MKNLKKRILGLTAGMAALCACAIAASHSHVGSNLDNNLLTANVEALTEDNEEYRIGITGTNWKTYHIECQKTVGIDYIIVVTKTTTYWADVCGYGWGECFAIAGC